MDYDSHKNETITLYNIELGIGEAISFHVNGRSVTTDINCADGYGTGLGNGTFTTYMGGQSECTVTGSTTVEYAMTYRWLRDDNGNYTYDPITGERALYLCPGMTTQISDMDPLESREMLDYLFEWSVRPEFVYDHQWKTGDCVLWDNACTMHRRGAFDSSEERWMKRTTILAPEELAIPF